MRIGIMQPYFFPYLGYFQLISRSDRFILFDDVQYIRHGWINRNRILKPGGGWQYVVAPLQKHRQTDLIKDISFHEDDAWKEKIVRQLEHYKKKAPHYRETMELLNRCFQLSDTHVTRYNAAVLELICRTLGVPFTIEISSQMNLDYSNVNDAGEWALKICEQIGAKEYINPPGGKDLFDPMKFEKAGIKLNFLSPALSSYNQRQEPFEPGLSIIDVLMYNGIDNTRKMVLETENVNS